MGRRSDTESKNAPRCGAVPHASHRAVDQVGDAGEDQEEQAEVEAPAPMATAAATAAMTIPAAVIMSAVMPRR